MRPAQAQRGTRLAVGAVCLFFAVLFLVGCATIRDYGAPFDELTEMRIFCANAKEYSYRLEGAQGTSFYASLPVERISESIEKDHGMSAYYPLIPFLPWISENIQRFSTAWSFLTWCWFMVGCLSLYGLMRRLNAGRALACCGALLLYLSPRFFAEGHYNNKDVVLLSLVLCCLWLGARLLQRPTALRGLLFSLAGALATNMKVAGALPWGLMGLAAVLSLCLGKGWSRSTVRAALVTVLSYLGFYFLLTPAMWDGPVAYVGYLLANATRFTRFGGNVLFRGADFYDILGETPLPRYYIPYYIATTVPLYTLALAAYGQVRALGEAAACLKQRDPQRLNRGLLLLAATLAWLLPLLYAVLGRPIVYNGWRHFYFVYAGMVVLAGYGLVSLFAKTAGKRLWQRAAAGALALCLGVSGVGIALNHPFEFAYFNPLQPRDCQYTMDLDYWHAGAAGAFQRLYQLKKDQPGPLRVGCYYSDITLGAYKLVPEIAEKLVVTAGREEPYLYYNSTYAHNYWVQEPPEGYHVLFACRSYGNTLSVMYERDGL